MLNKASALEITLEINQEANLDELMTHLFLMQDAMPAQQFSTDGLLPDFTIHEGELDPREGC